MIPKPLFLKRLTSQNRAVLFKIRLTPAISFAILQTYLYPSASVVLEEDASESNANHSSTSAGKIMNISIPAILWSFDTISVSTSYALPRNHLL